MERFEAPKGTKDIFGKDMFIRYYLERLFERLMILHGYTHIQTPIFESAKLFNRGVGEGSDIVNKEMYLFTDKGGREMALRPEFTAGVIRALISNKLYTKPLPIKLGYGGPAFRYERPQAGRFRQFHQLGVEVFNNDTSMDTFEVLLLVRHYFVSVELDQKVEIVINALGNEDEIIQYKEALTKYFKAKVKNMCPDCQKRFETNILRILDCKNEEDRVIIEKAPKLSDFVSKESTAALETMVNALKSMNFETRIDPYLVRGLDYYSGIVFEIRARDNGLALGGGGQYSKLVQELGGPDLKGVGMSLGLDRVASVFEKAMEEQGVDFEKEPAQNFAILNLVDDPQKKYLGYEILDSLRQLNFFCYIDNQAGSIGKKISRAEKNKTEMAIIIGEDEINNHQITLQNLHSREKYKIELNNDTMYEEIFRLHNAYFNNNLEEEENNDEETPV